MDVVFHARTSNNLAEFITLYTALTTLHVVTVDISIGADGVRFSSGGILDVFFPTDVFAKYTYNRDISVTMDAEGLLQVFSKMVDNQKRHLILEYIVQRETKDAYLTLHVQLSHATYLSINTFIPNEETSNYVELVRDVLANYPYSSGLDEHPVFGVV